MSNLNGNRKIINKYSDSENDIKNYQLDKGEIVISTVKNNEGIYIKNSENLLVKIGNIDENQVFEIVNKIMDDSGVSKHFDVTESEYDTLINGGTIIRTDKDGNNIEIKYDENVYYMVYEDDVE
jgi:hypothetical protein